MNPHGDEAIQDPVSLRLSKPTLTLEPSGLDGGPPQEVLVVEVVHGIVEIGVTLPVQTIHDTRVLGVRVDNVGTRMGVPSLVGTRDVDLSNAIGILGDARHGNDEMVRWKNKARFVGFGRGADDELAP